MVIWESFRMFYLVTVNKETSEKSQNPCYKNGYLTLDEFQPKKISVYFSKSKHSQRSKIIKAGLCNSEHALSMSNLTQVANCADLPS